MLRRSFVLACFALGFITSVFRGRWALKAAEDSVRSLAEVYVSRTIHGARVFVAVRLRHVRPGDEVLIKEHWPTVYRILEYPYRLRSGVWCVQAQPCRLAAVEERFLEKRS